MDTQNFTLPNNHKITINDNQNCEIKGQIERIIDIDLSIKNITIDIDENTAKIIIHRKEDLENE